MAQQIEDGTGTSNRVRVTENNRMETFSTTSVRNSDISRRTGESFIITSDFISLTTTASFSALLYIKNTSAKDLYVDKIRICGTGASMSSLQTKMVKNPTAGTLISDANDGIAIPSNLGSSSTFEGSVFAASGDAKTITDGTQFSQFTVHLPGHSIQEYDGALIVPKGSSMSIEGKPGIASEVCVEIQCWYE